MLRKNSLKYLKPNPSRFTQFVYETINKLTSSIIDIYYQFTIFQHITLNILF